VGLCHIWAVFLPTFGHLLASAAHKASYVRSLGPSKSSTVQSWPTA